MLLIEKRKIQFCEHAVDERKFEMTEVNSIFRIEKLNDKNYNAWSFRMRAVLKERKVWNVIDDAAPVATAEAAVKIKWNDDNGKAKDLMGLAISDGDIAHIQYCVTGKEAWETLRNLYREASLSGRVRVLKRIFRMKLEHGGSMRDHVNNLMGALEELAGMEKPMDDDMAVSVLLASLGEEYDSLVTGIESWNETRITFINVKSKLLEEWKKKTDANDVGSALKVKPVFTCYNCKQPGHMKRNCPNFSTDKKDDLRTFLNFKNREMSKFRHEDWNKDNQASAKTARLDKWYSCFVSSNGGANAGWVVDSGATSHMCSDKNLFSELNNAINGKITVANGQVIDAIGEGKVKIVLDKGYSTMEVELTDVLWVPELDGNLVSVKKLVDNGFAVEFRGNWCYLINGRQKLKIAEYKDKMYVIKEVERCFQANGVVETELCVHEWHRRLAHRHFKDIRLMANEGLKIKPCICIDECLLCVRGKMARKPFPKKATPVTNVMDCVVSDVCGAMQVESASRKRYFITFIDLFSKFSEVVFIREKSEVPKKTIEFIEKMKTQLGRKPKTFRSDRGTEYTAAELQNYLLKEGIKFQCTVGYTPQQNGVSERKNRTLMEAARTMLADSGLSKTLWAEAVNTANYVFNRLIDQKTKLSPYEIIFGSKPRMDYFHEFGCDALVMIPDQKRKKLDEKAKPMKFVGYDEWSKGFRMVDENNKIVISREVYFLKTKKNFKQNSKDNFCEFLDFDASTQEQDDAQIYDDECEDDDDVHEKENVILISDGDDNMEIQIDAANGHVGALDDDVFDDALENDQNEDVQDEHENRMEEVLALPIQNERQLPELQSSNRPLRIRNQVNYFESTRMAENVREMVELNVHGKSDDLMYEPKSFNDAMRSPLKHRWMKAMQEELSSIESNGTWEALELPRGKNAVGSKWVYKIKKDDSGNAVQYKARLVAQGFSQKFGVDYDEVFAPVARSTTFRLLLSIAGIRGYQAKHYDIKTAFLNGKLSEEIYMKQPPGFKIGEKVYRLKKSLYGLKQAARVWNETLHHSLINCGFKQNDTDKCLYSMNSGGDIVYLLIHVDDILAVTNKEAFARNLMMRIGKDFELKDLGEAKHYLGIDINQNANGEFEISQTSYIDKIVDAADLGDAKISKFPMDSGYFKLDGKLLDSNDEYRKLIGMLLYLTTNTRPDIAACVSILSQKVSCPRDVDLNEVKRTIRYLKATKNLKLRLSSKDCGEKLFAYSDANWAEDRHDRKSNSGYYCSFNGGAIAWCCRKQDIIALSSTEAEYIALTDTCKEMIWLKRLAAGLNVDIPMQTTIYTDSQSSISMINNQKFSNRTKHIDTKFHFVQEQVNNGTMRLKYVSTEDNVADMMTKPLGSIRMKKLREMAGLQDR